MSSQLSPAFGNSGNVEMQSGQTICSSILEISDGKGNRPLPRRLLLTSTHLHVQRNVGRDAVVDNDADSNRPTHGSVSDRGLSGEGSFDSFGEALESPPPECNKREVTLHRVDGTLGLSVRGGAEHDLPLIISRLTPGTPAALCKQVFIGDAIIANLLETNLTQWDGSGGNETDSEQWENERSIPLLFALLTRYVGGMDRLRCNAFEVRDSTGNCSTGVVHCGDPYSLTSWTKCVADAILGLNNIQIKLWMQETPSEIYYVGWIWEGNTEECGVDGTEPWITWKQKGIGSDGWDGGESWPVVTSLLRVLSPGEHLDERQHCFTLQIATENSSFPPNGSRTQPVTFYLNTETRQELIKVENAWTKAVTSAVKSTKGILIIKRIIG